MLQVQQGAARPQMLVERVVEVEDKADLHGMFVSHAAVRACICRLPILVLVLHDQIEAAAQSLHARERQPEGVRRRVPCCRFYSLP